MLSASSWLLVMWTSLYRLIDHVCLFFKKNKYEMQLLFKTWSQPKMLLHFISLTPPCPQAKLTGSMCVSCSMKCFFMVFAHFYAMLRFFLFVGVLYIFLKLIFYWLYIFPIFSSSLYLVFLLSLETLLTNEFWVTIFMRLFLYN